MRKYSLRVILVLLSIAVAFSVVGCGDTEKPTSPPTQTAFANPSASTSPQGSPEPAPSTPPANDSPEPGTSERGGTELLFDLVMLVLDEYYYLGGDPDLGGIMFLEDGSITTTEDDEGTYEVDDKSISIFYDGEMTAELTLVDDSIIYSEDSGEFFIREGGPRMVTEDLDLILFSEYYFLDGDSDEVSYYFYDDGDVDIGTSDEWERGIYLVSDYTLTVILEGEIVKVLGFVNIAELEDIKTTEIYALEDALSYELVTSAYYYQDGDEDADNLWFYDDGDVDLQDSDGETETGTYTVQGDTISVTYGEDSADLEIVNSYILEADNGMMFIRLP